MNSPYLRNQEMYDIMGTIVKKFHVRLISRRFTPFMQILCHSKQYLHLTRTILKPFLAGYLDFNSKVKSLYLA